MTSYDLYYEIFELLLELSYRTINTDKEDFLRDEKTLAECREILIKLGKYASAIPQSIKKAYSIFFDTDIFITAGKEVEGYEFGMHREQLYLLAVEFGSSRKGIADIMEVPDLDKFEEIEVPAELVPESYAAEVDEMPQDPNKIVIPWLRRIDGKKHDSLSEWQKKYILRLEKEWMDKDPFSLIHLDSRKSFMDLVLMDYEESEEFKQEQEEINNKQ